MVILCHSLVSIFQSSKSRYIQQEHAKTTTAVKVFSLELVDKVNGNKAAAQTPIGKVSRPQPHMSTTRVTRFLQWLENPCDETPAVYGGLKTHRFVESIYSWVVKFALWIWLSSLAASLWLAAATTRSRSAQRLYIMITLSEGPGHSWTVVSFIIVINSSIESLSLGSKGYSHVSPVHCHFHNTLQRLFHRTLKGFRPLKTR